MTITSFVISILGFLVAVFGAWLGRRSLTESKRSADAAERSATSSDRSADAAERSAVAAEGTRDAADAQASATAAQAAAARDQLAIDRERFHQEQTPLMEGSIKPRPAWLGGPEDKDRILEVRVRGNRTLSSLVLHLPVGAYIGRSRGLIGPMPQDFGYPEVGHPTIGPGNPAIWHIVVGESSPAEFTAVADCQDEYGRRWTDVEVTITRET